MLLPILLLIFVAFLPMGIGAFYFMKAQRHRRERYRSVITRTRDDMQKSDDKKLLAKQKADVARKLKEANAAQEEKKKDRTTIRELMLQAGIEAPLSRYWIWAVITAAGVWFLLMLFGWPTIAKVFITLAGFFALPKMFLRWKARRRQKKFLAEFADALDAMARLLQAGMPMSEAIAMASREFQGPLKEEMLRIYENQKIGVSIGEAALMSARRIPLPEVHMFATALQIQSETGSSLSEVLGNLSSVIRARFRLRRKVQALSSEAKSSAAIIGALPVLVMLALWAVRPEYIGQLFVKPTGKIMLYGSVFWMSLGVLMMRQMINFRI